MGCAGKSCGAFLLSCSGCHCFWYTFTMVRLQRRQQWLKLQGWVESRLRHLILKLETLLLKTGLAHPFPDAFQSPNTQERRLQLDRMSCRDAIAPLQRGFIACRLRFV